MITFKSLCAAALLLATSCESATAASIVQDQVLVTAPYGGGYDKPTNYETSYSLQLGIGSWPFPYVNIHFDDATGKTSYANVIATASYLTYIHDLTIFTVKPGNEISQLTLSNPTYKSLFTTTGWERQADWGNRAISSTGLIKDIYLGFSVKVGDQYPQYKTYPDNSNIAQHFGWVHLQYTQKSGLTMISSAMTLDGSGIYANSLETISSVDETSSGIMAFTAVLGIISANSRKRKLIHTKSNPAYDCAGESTQNSRTCS